MRTSMGMAGGSLAERHDAHQHDDALVCRRLDGSGEQLLDARERRRKFLRIVRRVARLRLMDSRLTVVADAVPPERGSALLRSWAESREEDEAGD
jgi:hypothetical protein